MPAASYLSPPIERSLSYLKNSNSTTSGSSNGLSFGGKQYQSSLNIDLTGHSILSSSIDFIKYDKSNSVLRYDKSKYSTLTPIKDLNANIDSICTSFKKTQNLMNINNNHTTTNGYLKLNNVNKKDNENNNNKCLLPKPKEILYSPDKIQLGWQGRIPIGAGLINAINTCYLNSCLQALFHIPSFHNWLLNDKDHQNLCEKHNGYMYECLVCAMRKTLEQCQLRSGSCIRPKLIIEKLKQIARHLEHHRQEDSHEFLTYLIEGMQKSYLKVIPGSNKLDSYSKETTPIYQLFGSYLRTEVTCSSCSHISTSYTHGTELSLDIRQSSSIDESLTQFFAKETLSGDNLYKCEKCGRKTEATKRFSIDKPPNVLRLQLKRFNYHGFKNSRQVSVPLNLEFGKFMHCKTSHSQLKYKLVSAVIHHGSSPDSGHYTCIGSTSSGTYHYFDDETVRPSNLELLKNAYVVIYELSEQSNNSFKSSFGNEFRNNSLHSSSPGLNGSISNNHNNNNNNLLKKPLALVHQPTTSTKLIGQQISNEKREFSPKKLIGPQLPSNDKHNNIISPVIKSNINVESLTNEKKAVQLPNYFKNNEKQNGINGSNSFNNGKSMPNIGSSKPNQQQNGYQKNHHEINGATSSPSVGKKTKLVDYESDDSSSTISDVDGEFSNKDRKRSSPVHKKHKTTVNGWTVIPADDEEGTKHEKKSLQNGGGASLSGGKMEWNVESVTTPPGKEKLFDTTSRSSSANNSAISSPDSSLSSLTPPSGNTSPSGSSYFNLGSSSSTTSASANTTPTKKLSVQEYLNNRNMNGYNNSYGSSKVTSWGNEPSSLVESKSSQDKQQSVPSNNKFPLHNARPTQEDDDEDMDRGRVKKMKSSKFSNNKNYNNHKDSAYSRGTNPFNHYQHHKNNYHGNQDRYHYYSNNKYHNRYNQHHRHKPYHWQRRR